MKNKIAEIPIKTLKNKVYSLGKREPNNTAGKQGRILLPLGIGRGNGVYAALALVLLGVSGLVRASGFALEEQNGSGMGNAYAGAAAVAEDASTIYFNPAGMSYLPDSQLVAAAQLVNLTSNFQNSGSNTISPTGAPTPLRGSNGGDISQWAAFPNFYYAKALSDDVHVGLGLNAPFGFRSSYYNNWVGRYQSVTTDLKTLNINPSISFKAHDMLSLGVGLDVQGAKATLTNALDGGTICYGKVGPGLCSGVLGLTPQNNDIGSAMNGEDWTMGYNLGVMFQPLASTRFGLSYRSKMHYNLKGHVNFSNVPPALASNLVNSPVTARIDMPDSLAASMVHDISDQWRILADVTWTRWGKFNQLTVINSNTGQVLSNQPENWTSSMRYSIGSTYRFNQDLKFRTGFAFDQSPVPSADRTAAIPDSDRYWLSAGMNYKITSSTSLDAAYTHIFMPNASINQGSVGSATGQLVGSYSSNINMISLQLTQNF